MALSRQTLRGQGEVDIGQDEGDIVNCDQISQLSGYKPFEC